MLKKVKEKLQSKKGGLKELLYDNIGIFIVGVLIVVTLFVASNQVKSRADNNKTTIKNIEDNIKSTSFIKPEIVGPGN